jgi:hypothetical protein
VARPAAHSFAAGRRTMLRRKGAGGKEGRGAARGWVDDRYTGGNRVGLVSLHIGFVDSAARERS